MTSACDERPSVDRSLKNFMAELVRAPSPDSACEQDELWNMGSGGVPLGASSGQADSDGDSGIDGSVDRFSQRVGSSAVPSRHDVTVRTPTSVEPDGRGSSAGHLDEGLPFSEQHMRRSCRQLIAAMYASPPPTCGLRWDARTAGRLSLAGKEPDEQFAAKRLSVPAARTPPPSYEQVSAARTKLSIAPTPDLDRISATGTPFGERNSAAARQHPIPASNDPNASTSVRLVPPVNQNRRRLGDLSGQGDPSAPPKGKQQDVCTPETFRCSSKTTQQDWASGQLSNKQAGLDVHAYDGKEAASLIPPQPQFTHEPQRGDEKIRDSALRKEFSTVRLSEEKTRGAEFTRAAPTHMGPRIAQLRWAAPVETVGARVPPSQPVCSRSTSSMLGPRPKTALPPRALPLSLPGTPSFSEAGPAVIPRGAMRIVFARPAAVVADATSSSAAETRTAPLCTAAQSCTPPARHVSGDYSSQPERCRPLPVNEATAEYSRPGGGRSTADVTMSPRSTSLPTLAGETSKGPAKVAKGRVEYALVTNKAKYHRSPLAPRGSTCVMGERPPRMHNSDFALYRGSSSSVHSGTANSSTSNLLERVQGIGRSAKSALLRAFSTERIYRPQKVETAAGVLEKELVDNPDGVPRASPAPPASLVTGLKARMSLRRKSKRLTREDVAATQINTAPVSACSDDPVWTGGQPTDVSCQLLQQSLDGTQVVELRRPPGRSFGFFLARGRLHSHHGVFVSRMHDARARKVLHGLLDVGDEILEVNGTDVRDADIVTVNSLMKNQTTVLLTVLPYVSRTDVSRKDVGRKDV